MECLPGGTGTENPSPWEERDPLRVGFCIKALIRGSTVFRKPSENWSDCLRYSSEDDKGACRSDCVIGQHLLNVSAIHRNVPLSEIMNDGYQAQRFSGTKASLSLLCSCYTSDTHCG
jgi:hypothetical protein